MFMFYNLFLADKEIYSPNWAWKIAKIAYKNLKNPYIVNACRVNDYPFLRPFFEGLTVCSLVTG